MYVLIEYITTCTSFHYGVFCIAYKMNYRNWWDLGKWMLIQIVCVCKTALRIFISKKAGCWTVLEKNAIAFIFFLALKSLTIWSKTVNNTTKKKLFRVSDLDTKSDAYIMANWVHRLINCGRNKEIQEKNW